MERDRAELHEQAGGGRRDRLRGQHHRQHVDERGRDFGRQDDRHVQLRDERHVGEPEEVRQPGVWRQRPAARARDIGSGQPTSGRVGGECEHAPGHCSQHRLCHEPRGEGGRRLGPTGRRRDRQLRGARDRSKWQLRLLRCFGHCDLRGRRRGDGAAVHCQRHGGTVHGDGKRRRCVDPRQFQLDESGRVRPDDRHDLALGRQLRRVRSAQYELRLLGGPEEQHDARYACLPQVQPRGHLRNRDQGDVPRLHADVERLGLRVTWRCRQQLGRARAHLQQQAGGGWDDRLGRELHGEHLDERGCFGVREGRRRLQLRDERDLDESQAVLKQGGRQPGAARDRVHAGSGGGIAQRDGRRRSDDDGRDCVPDATRGQGGRCLVPAGCGRQRHLQRTGERGQCGIRRWPQNRLRHDRRKRHRDGAPTGGQCDGRCLPGERVDQWRLVGGDVQPHEHSGCSALDTDCRRHRRFVRSLRCSGRQLRLRDCPDRPNEPGNRQLRQVRRVRTQRRASQGRAAALGGDHRHDHLQGVSSG